MPEKTFLDAASIVLNDAGKSMTAQDIINEVLRTRNLWKRKGLPETEYKSLYGTLIKAVKAGDHRIGRIENSSQFYSLQNVKNLNQILIPEELTAEESLNEGLATKITVNRYERNQKARALCIDHYGTNCSVCGLDFREVYGDIGNDYIHVHHVIQLSDIKNEYKVDPIGDLRPVCPNCHAMIHRKTPAMSIDELKKLIAQQKNQADAKSRAAY